MSLHLTVTDYTFFHVYQVGPGLRVRTVAAIWGGDGKGFAFPLPTWGRLGSW